MDDHGSVVEAVATDLARLPAALAGSAPAMGLLALAEGLDSPRNSLTSKSMAFKALLEGWEQLRALAPPEVANDKIDELTRRRSERHGRVAASAG